MSDEKKDEHKDAAKGEHKDDKAKKDAKPAGKPSAIKALIGPLAAVVLLLGAGVGIGIFLAKFFSKPPEPTAAVAKGKGGHGAEAEGHDAAGAGDGGHGKDGEGHDEGLLHSAKEMVVEDIVTNVKDQGGKRFIKLSPAFWLTKAAVEPLGLAGGDHGGGGEAGGEIKRIIKARIEEHLKQYDLEELTSQGIYKRLETNLMNIADKEIRAFAPALAKEKDKPIVLKVVLVGLVVQ